MTVAAWSGPKCGSGAVDIELYDPVDMCLGKPLGEGAGIVLGSRGKCAIPDKVLRGASRDWVVIVNNALGPQESINGGGAKASNGVGSVGSEVGKGLIQTLLVNKTAVKGRVMCGLPPPLAPGSDDHGTLITEHGEASVAWAGFGLGERPAHPVVFRRVRHEHACNVNQVTTSLRGAVAVVVRGGGCGFGDKALVCQKAGAIGVIIVDKGAEIGQKMQSTPEQADEIRIWAGMAGKDFDVEGDEDWGVIRPLR